MGLNKELSDQVAKIFREQWSQRDGTVVPDSPDLKLYNDAVNLNATVLYADMAESTNLVDGHYDYFAAEIYKTYLYCAAKIIKAEGGEITAYDGDRIMAVFIGKSKNTSATRAAMKINYTRLDIINPSIQNQYNTSYELNHVIGIDTSKLFVARTGIRGSNDLVWVGRAANHAAKLTSLPHSHSIRITKEVYDAMHNEVKYDHQGDTLWEQATWNDQNRIIYRGNCWWRLP